MELIVSGSASQFLLLTKWCQLKVFNYYAHPGALDGLGLELTEGTTCHCHLSGSGSDSHTVTRFDESWCQSFAKKKSYFILKLRFRPCNEPMLKITSVVQPRSTVSLQWTNPGRNTLRLFLCSALNTEREGADVKTRMVLKAQLADVFQPQSCAVSSW